MVFFPNLKGTNRAGTLQHKAVDELHMEWTKAVTGDVSAARSPQPDSGTRFVDGPGEEWRKFQLFGTIENLEDMGTNRSMLRSMFGIGRVRLRPRVAEVHRKTPETRSGEIWRVDAVLV